MKIVYIISAVVFALCSYYVQKKTLYISYEDWRCVFGTASFV